MCLAFWSAQTGSHDTGFARVGGCQLDLQLSTDTRLLQADNPPIPKFVIDPPAKRFKEAWLVQSVQSELKIRPQREVWFSHDRLCPCSGKDRQRDHCTFEEKSWIGTSSVSAPKHEFDFIMNDDHHRVSVLQMYLEQRTKYRWWPANVGKFCGCHFV